MKTTILLDDRLYERLVREAIRRHGSARNLSQTINELLARQLSPTRSLFGALEPFTLADLRDEHDRPI